MMFNFDSNGSKIQFPMITRKSIDSESLRELLLNFDIDFVNYLGHIKKIIIPEDFENTNISFKEMIEYALNFEK